MRNTRKISLATCKFNFQNKNITNTNKAKSLELEEKLQIAKQASGITLIALVVSIVVLLILARSKHFNSTWK